MEQICFTIKVDRLEEEIGSRTGYMLEKDLPGDGSIRRP